MKASFRFLSAVSAFMVVTPPPVLAQSDLRDAADDAFKRADAQLNSAYARLQAKLKAHPTQAKRLASDLQKVQRTWIAYRDAEAALRAGISSEGGSAYSIDYLAALTDLTQERTSELQKVLSK